MNKIVKIDRIGSTTEAEAFAALGTDLLTVCLDPDPRFADDRTVTTQAATAIRSACGGSRMVAALDLRERPERALEVAVAVGANFVQPINYEIPPLDLRRELLRAGIGIVYSNIEVAHDDDPSWILSRFADVPELGAAYLHLDLLPEYRDSWAFLRDSSPEYDEELQIQDINGLADDHDLLIGLNFTAENLPQILAAMPGIAGIALTLGDRPNRDDVHHTDPATAFEVVNALRRFDTQCVLRHDARRGAPGAPGALSSSRTVVPDA